MHARSAQAFHAANEESHSICSQVHPPYDYNETVLGRAERALSKLGNAPSKAKGSTMSNLGPLDRIEGSLVPRRATLWRKILSRVNRRPATLPL